MPSVLSAVNAWLIFCFSSSSEERVTKDGYLFPYHSPIPLLQCHSHTSLPHSHTSLLQCHSPTPIHLFSNVILPFPYISSLMSFPIPIHPFPHSHTSILQCHSPIPIHLFSIPHSHISIPIPIHLFSNVSSFSPGLSVWSLLSRAASSSLSFWRISEHSVAFLSHVFLDSVNLSILRRTSSIRAWKPLLAAAIFSFSYCASYNKKEGARIVRWGGGGRKLTSCLDSAAFFWFSSQTIILIAPFASSPSRSIHWHSTANCWRRCFQWLFLFLASFMMISVHSASQKHKMNHLRHNIWVTNLPCS